MPKFAEFLARFPTVGDCAAASIGDVVDAWHGLGYNRRAVNLHRVAVQVSEQHGGVLPDDLDALLALPGIGPYTARAVLVFAFERDIGLVDTNAGRFVSRARGASRRPGRSTTAGRRRGAARAGVGVGSDRVRPWRRGVHKASAVVRRMSDLGFVRLGALRVAVTRSRHWVGGREQGPVPVRRLVSRRAWPPCFRAAGRTSRR